jgi:ABC-type Zn2+ transport system substrate-binding protein/surface adhesin
VQVLENVRRATSGRVYALLTGLIRRYDLETSGPKTDHLREHVHQHDTEHKNEDEHEHEADQEAN